MWFFSSGLSKQELVSRGKKGCRAIMALSKIKKTSPMTLKIYSFRETGPCILAALRAAAVTKVNSFWSSLRALREAGVQGNSIRVMHKQISM